MTRVSISADGPDVIQRKENEPETIRNRHSLSRIVISMFASDAHRRPSIILNLLPLFALIMMARISAVIIFTILDAQKISAGHEMIENQTDAIRTPTSFKDEYLKYLSVSSLEYHFQPSAILWTLYPTVILLIFRMRAGGWRSKGGSWLKMVLNIVENESSDATKQTIPGLDFDAEQNLRRGSRIGLIINLIMVTIRGTLLLTLGSIIPTPVFINNQTPIFAYLWTLPQICWLYYSSFLMLIAIFYLESVSNYFVASFEIINRMIRELIASAGDTTKIGIDRSQTLRAILRNHDSACAKVAEYNNFWSYHLLASYFILIPISGVNLYQGIFSDHGNQSERVLIIISAVEAFVLIGKISGICASINKLAHSSYPLLIRVSFQEFPVELQIQLRLLIQRLSGPKIGFYCAALFEISRATFFAILVALGQNFFLIVQIAKHKNSDKHD